MWIANHYFNKPLKYMGFGGQGQQVRDLLHPDDLFDAVRIQSEQIDRLSGEVFNLGGGIKSSTSLCELTDLCKEATGKSVPIGSDPTTTPVDIPLYVSDCKKAEQYFEWKAGKNVKNIVDDTLVWLQEYESITKQIFA